MYNNVQCSISVDSVHTDFALHWFPASSLDSLSYEVKLQGTGDCSILKSLLSLDLHGVKFEQISRIFYPILHILVKIKVQVVSSVW